VPGAAKDCQAAGPPEVAKRATRGQTARGDPERLLARAGAPGVG